MVSLPPGSRLGRYQMVEGIGRGGMASVFKAHDPELNRHVAVKVIPSYQSDDPTFVERFRQEAQAVARLNHPNVVQVHDFGEDKGFSYIVMEHMTGGTLHELMDGPLPVDRVSEICGPLAEALDYAHGEGVVHRDVKPANVLLDRGGNPKLSDFGLARLLEGGAGLTRGPSVLGTPEYMSPEQALGRPADQKSDLYAFGVMVYQMLVGQTPFRARTPIQTLMAHIHEPVPPPSSLKPGLDPGIEAVLLRALAKEPGDRHASARAFVLALGGRPEKSDAVSDEELDSRATIETPMPKEAADAHDAKVEERAPVSEVRDQDRISADQASVLAIRHARDNTDFYGPRYADKELVWQTASAEEEEHYFQITLSYRPARRFWGQPGTELFTVDRSGSIELRQILDEPSEGFRQLVNESVEIRGVRFPLVGGVLVVVIGVLVAALMTRGVNQAQSPDDESVPAPPGAVSIALVTDKPAQLVSPQGEVTVDLGVGSVDSNARLWYQAMSRKQVTSPGGFQASDKVFELSVVGDDGAVATPFAFSKPIALTVRISAQDAWDADGVEVNVVIQRFDRDVTEWVPLQTSVDFRASQARAEISGPGLFGLFIKTVGAAATPTSALITSPRE